MKIERFADPPREWDRFVEAHPSAHLSHASAWAKVFRNVYGLNAFYLAAIHSDGTWCGVLPMVRVRSLLGRSQLVSLPYLDGGGILANGPDTEQALLAEALRIARELGCVNLELRQLAPLAAREHPALPGRVRMVLELEPTEEEQWGALRAKVRNQTRKAERSGLELLPEGDAHAFFAPFAANMRDLGTPVHPRRFFEAAAEAFGSRFRFVVTASEGRPVGALVAIAFAGCVSVPWAATYREERARCPNNQIYWEALRWAIAQNARRFDFGRSHRDAGTHRFKRGWGAEELPLYWLCIDGAGSQRVPEAEASRGAFRIASACWSKLPIGLANWLGPHVRPHLLS